VLRASGTHPCKAQAGDQDKIATLLMRVQRPQEPVVLRTRLICGTVTCRMAVLARILCMHCSPGTPAL
jgi:hypothetical protein